MKLIIVSWFVFVLWKVVIHLLSVTATTSGGWVHASPKVTKRYSVYFWDHDPGVLAWIRPWIGMGLLVIALGVTSLYSRSFSISCLAFILLFARTIFGAFDDKTNGSAKGRRFIGEVIMGGIFVAWFFFVLHHFFARQA